MYGDFSRVLDPGAGRYSAVLAQQGRLLLDAELNEQTSILLEYLRRLTTDLIGPFAGPMHGAGFAVDPVDADGKCHAVRLSPGHYYVFGVRCEAPAPGHGPTAEVSIGGDHEPPFIVYLTAWEQSVSALSAPELAEPALGSAGADTTRRRQVRWHLSAARHLPGSHEDLTTLDPEQIAAAFREYDTAALGRPRLGARAVPVSEAAATPTTTASSAAYRGAENQLYRVEVHRGGAADDATFKWSRDNGSVELALESLGELGPEGTRQATIHGPWSDARRGLEVGDWVELVDDRSVPFGASLPLMQVQRVSMASRELTLADTHSERALHAADHPLLRRWDQPGRGPAPHHGIALADADGEWFELEDGVEVQFTESGARYQRGDYWLIPAREATGGVLWPRAEDQPYPLALSPSGPARFLAPLALITSLTTPPTDLRTRFAHVAGPEPTPAKNGPPVADPAPPPPEDPPPPHPPHPTTDATVIRPEAVRFGLRSIASFDNGKSFDLPPGETRLGRDPSAGIQIPHPDVSRDHAAFTATPDVLDVRDLDSKNGTWVNDERLVPHVSTELSGGDRLTLGTEEVVLEVLDVGTGPPQGADDDATTAEVSPTADDTTQT